jgi:hypothetical protein
MADETNGQGKGRLERIEQLIEVLVNEHLKTDEQYRELMRVQVLLSDAQRQTAEALAVLTRRVETMAEVVETMATVQQADRDRMRGLDERVDKLVAAIGEFLRRLPPAF